MRSTNIIHITGHWTENDEKHRNHFNTVEQRTANHLEGYHSKLKRGIQHTHPNIFSLITLLQRMKLAKAVRMLQYAARVVRPTKGGKYRFLQRRLAVLKQPLKSEEITRKNYADATSYF